MPGSTEAELGLPFTGRAGKFLDELLNEVSIPQDKIYISNTCRCRPLDNRTPTSEEAKICVHYLLHEIKLLKPSVIVCLGKTAAQYFLPEVKSSTQMKSIAGQTFKHPAFEDIDVIVTYHPAFLLRPNGQPYIPEMRTHLARARQLLENKRLIEVKTRNEDAIPKVQINKKFNSKVAKFIRII